MIHIGVNIRLFPTTGMPFLSYGGSSIVSVSILSGNLEFDKKKSSNLKVQKILITTGSQVGVTPARIINEYLNKDYEIFYSTDNRGLKYLSSKIDKTIIIDTPKLNLSFFLPHKILKLIFLIFKSLIHLKNKNFTKVISIGGYMSLL